MTPERFAKIQETTENMPNLVSRDGWDEVFGPSFDAEGKPDDWGCGIVAVSLHYDRPEALGMFLAGAKPTILELCNEIAVLRNSESVNAEEYEKRCEALQLAIAQRDAARKERDYFLATVGNLVGTVRRSTPDASLYSQLVTDMVTLYDDASARFLRVGAYYSEPQQGWLILLRAAVDKWLLEYGEVIG